MVLSVSTIKFLLIVSYGARIVLTLLPQYGYIHPDEFFQFTEPVLGDLLLIKWLKTWEFTTPFPIRSVGLPFLITSPVVLAREWFDIKLDGYALLVIPRVIMTILSFLVDLVLYRISEKTMGWRWHLPCLIYSTSFLTLCFMTHTFTNAIETILLALVVLIVVESMNEKKPSQPLFLGHLLAIGVFNRPTFMAFALVPTIFWMLAGRGRFVRKIITNGTKLVPSFFLTSIFMVAIDTLYYRPALEDEIAATILKGPEAVVKKITNEYFLERVASMIVVTPYNFIIYNTNPSNLAKHGLHNYYHHILINVPFVFGLVGIFAYLDAVSLITRRKNLRAIPAKTMMFFTFWLSLAILSVIAHQEGRFLMPLIISLTYIYGDRFRTRKKLFFLWLLFNTILTYFYGFVHQAGVVHSLLDLNNKIQSGQASPIDLIIARTYLPPLTLLQLSANDMKNVVHDLSIEPNFVNAVQKRITSILKKKDRNSIYLAIPSCLAPRLADIISMSPYKIWFKIVKSYFPHFTHEDFDASWKIFVDSLGAGNFFEGLRNAFSFNLYQVFQESSQKS